MPHSARAKAGDGIKKYLFQVLRDFVAGHYVSRRPEMGRPNQL